MEKLDQVFVLVKQALLALLPELLRPLASIVLSVAAILGTFATLFAVTTLVERKLLGRIQNRPGPNRVGPWGVLQPMADGIKMLTKEDVVPRAADHLVHFFAPLVLIVPVTFALSVIPFGRNMVAVELEAGLLFFFAVGGAAEVSVFMAGWASRNKYSLLGAMRAIAQMISYEVPLVLSTIPVVMIAGSLSLPRIVEAQSTYQLGFLSNWNVFTPWGFAAFLLFLVGSLAESNRSPFDLPEAESEIIAGYLTEYSGFKYALFFLGEYWGMFAISGLGVTLFLGGWTAPFSFLAWIPSYVWFFSKLIAIILLFIWIRGTLPRLRFDQLLGLAWKFMLPMALCSIMSAAVWHFTSRWTFPTAGLWRWLLGAVIVAVPYVLLGRALAARRVGARRTYRFAT